MQEMWETWVWSLGQEDSLEEGMATHFSIFAWRIPWTEEAGGLQSTEVHRVAKTQIRLKQLSTQAWKFVVKEMKYQKEVEVIKVLGINRKLKKKKSLINAF